MRRTSAARPHADGVIRTDGRRRARRGAAATAALRLLTAVVSVSLVAGFALASPASANDTHATSREHVDHRDGRTDTASLTKDYVETFYPLWFYNTQQKLVNYNIMFGPNRISPIYHAIVAINNDTLYASAFINVTTEPVILTVPATPAGYSVLNLDTYGVAYPSGVPSKPSGTNTPTTVYALVKPGYTGPIPLGAIRVQMPLNISIQVFRVDRYAPDGTDQNQAATDFRAGLKTLPMSQYVHDHSGGAAEIRPEILFSVPFKTIADTLVRVAPIRFLAMLQDALRSVNNPPMTPQEQALSDAFDARFGTGGSGLGPAARAAFSRGARAAHAAILSNYLDHRGRNNWIHFTNIANWGDQVLDRASITEFIQVGNGINTAAYYHTFLDGNGAPLNGDTPGGYVMTFRPKGQPPAARFWSLTAYTPQAIELIPNPANKYLVARYTPGLVTNRDGSVSIYISRIKPAGVPAANWLPVSHGPFNVMLRVYGVIAGSSVANNRYVAPPVVPRLASHRDHRGDERDSRGSHH
jgi:hypothetical protein